MSKLETRLNRLEWERLPDPAAQLRAERMRALARKAVEELWLLDQALGKSPAPAAPQERMDAAATAFGVTLHASEIPKSISDRSRQQRDAVRKMGAIRASMGASGFTMDSDSNLSILAENAEGSAGTPWQDIPHNQSWASGT